MPADSKQLRLRFSKYIANRVDAHKAKEGLNNTTLFRKVFDEFLEFYDAMDPEARPRYQFKSAPADVDETVTFYVKNEVKDRLDAIKGTSPHADVYYTALLKYMQKHDLFDMTFESTPAVSRFQLLSSQVKLIKVLVVEGRFESMGGFYMAAVKHWLERREAYTGDYYMDYISRPIDQGDSDDLQDLYVTLPVDLHRRLSYLGKIDNQTIRTVLYNAIVGFLDHLLDEELEAASGEEASAHIVSAIVTDAAHEK